MCFKLCIELLSPNILINKHSDACIQIVEYKFSCEMEAHVEVTTSLMFDCNIFKDKRDLLILVAITLPSKSYSSATLLCSRSLMTELSKELQFCNFTMW